MKIVDIEVIRFRTTIRRHPTKWGYYYWGPEQPATASLTKIVTDDGLEGYNLGIYKKFKIGNQGIFHKWESSRFSPYLMGHSTDLLGLNLKRHLDDIHWLVSLQRGNEQLSPFTDQRCIA